ncbi:MAG: IS1634 family transposase [Mesoflavibacter sp.]|nr:IS1634 family transposase [Mesoflavibacter sp.]
MYIESVPNRKSPPTLLLRESYREKGVVKKRTIANLTKWPKKLIADMKSSLAGKTIEEQSEVQTNIINELESGPVFGVLAVLKNIADEIGITKALGTTRLARLTLFLILARISHQGSRLSAVRWVRNHAVKEVLDLNYFNEDDLYMALDWVEENQEKIEKILYKKYVKENGQPPVLVLYDITSAYLEGEMNELGEYGYDRDKKKGKKKQIVIGLLTGPDGEPLSVEVFRGNTTDPTTVSDQIKKLINRFGVDEVVFVGDRGMVKTKGKKAIKAIDNFFYITALTDPQIRKLLKEDIFQVDLFDEKIMEVAGNEGKRYILRRGQSTQSKEHYRREDKVKRLRKLIKERNIFVSGSARAKPEAGLKKLNSWTIGHKISSFVSLSLENSQLKMDIDKEKKTENSLLDGCYVIETDVSEDKLDKETVWDRYGDLQKVERDFRRMKTTLIEVRPIFVRKEKRTRGHVFISMLSLKIARLMESRLYNVFQTTRESDDAVTIKDAIAALLRLNLQYYHIGNQTVVGLPKPDKYQQKILDALNVKIKAPITTSIRD